jgi:hypothetical protein
MPLPPGYKPIPPPGEAPRTVAGETTDFLTSAWQKINPVEQWKGLSTMVRDMPRAGQAMLHVQDQLRLNALESFKRGDYLTGARQAINYAIPLFGPEIESASEKMATGQYGKSLGEIVGLGLNLTPASALRHVRLTPGFQNLNPQQARALQFLESQGVPVPAGTSTGSPFIQGVQKATAYTPGGALVAGRAQRQTTAALQRTAQNLAQQAYPQQVIPERAGAATAGALEQRGARIGGLADRNYAFWRNAQADPRNARPVQQGVDPQGQPIIQNVAMPVDIRQLKQDLLPIFEDMQFMAQADRNASAGYQAIRLILESPDFVPSTLAERALGGLKQLSREGAERSAGMARHIIPTLQGQIDQTVGSFNPRALQSLRRGRQLTDARYDTLDVLNRLQGRLEEPVQAFNRLVQPDDVNVAFLRDVNREVPGELPRVGRAYLERLFDVAQAEGGFDKSQTLLTQWQKLGPETKRLLYRNPALIDNLDKFFLGVKKLSENPNPSGSALVGVASGIGSAFMTDPMTGVKLTLGSAALAKLLYSPRGARLLREGLTIPITQRTRAASLFAQIARIAGEDVKRMEQKPMPAPAY